MTAPVIWVHGDCLDPRSPAFTAHPDAPAIFVFDDVVLDGYGVTLKRILFIYECLLEMPVTIRRGDVAVEVLAFAREHGADRIVTVATPSPRFATITRAIEADLPVEILSPAPFVPDRHYELKRFSRYWRDAEAQAMRRPDAAPTPVAPRLPGLEFS
jgi:hypothetical protein